MWPGRVPGSGKLVSELKFNVAQLLREDVGNRRDHHFELEALPIDDLSLRDVVGDVRFTRSASGVVAKVVARGTVRLTCVRSLDEFDEPIAVKFTDEFHSVVDVTTGAKLPKPRDDDPFFLSDTHMADVGEVIREYVLLELPMSPISPAHRTERVSYTIESDGAAAEQDEAAEVVDERLAVLKNLLKP